MRSIRHFFEQSWLLILASFCFGLLIATTNAALAPRIERNKIRKLTTLAGKLLAGTDEFVPLEAPIQVTAMDGRPTSMTVYRAASKQQTVGWVFQIVGFGFADKIELVLAADRPFETLAGFDVLTSNETPGFGDQIGQPYFRGQFKGAPARPFNLIKVGNPQQIDSDIVAITGATVSSTAVVEAMNHYISQVKEQLQQKGLIGNGSDL